MRAAASIPEAYVADQQLIASRILPMLCERIAREQLVVQIASELIAFARGLKQIVQKLVY